jgi:glycerol-3-phosphate dehydrogenase
VLGIANEFFPDARLRPEHVISVWAGLRPLIADPNGNPSDISRSHEIRSPEPGWWDVAGGKLTTYRLMAEQTIDEIVKWLKELKWLDVKVGKCRTAQEPLLRTSDIDGVSGILPPKFERRAVEHYVSNEWAVHLDDVMVRRTSWHYYFPNARLMAGQVADWMADLLGWQPEERAAELKRYSDLSSFP